MTHWSSHSSGLPERLDQIPGGEEFGTIRCQTVEIQIRAALMNRLSACGTAEIIRVA